MTAEEVLTELESLGTEQNRKIYRRHGVGENQYGVSYAHLKQLAKRLKKSHDVAVALWASGNHDARVLATMTADPAQLTAKLEAWARDLDNPVIAGAFADLAAQTATAKAKAEKWIKARSELIATAGWVVVARLTTVDASLPDEWFAAHLETIERDIHTSKNRVRYAMNNAVIAIGCRNAALKEKALATAATVGPVEVDHGETGCKTPDAAAYIEKVHAHRKAD